MPPGQEETASRFYAGLLGFKSIPKPSHLDARGGCWFRSEEVELHLGIEGDFRAARRAHPAFIVDDLAAIRSRLEASGYEITIDEQIVGFERFYVGDPFGNRLEIMESVDR
jgi:hypothetical protein